MLDLSIGPNSIIDSSSPTSKLVASFILMSLRLSTRSYITHIVVISNGLIPPGLQSWTRYSLRVSTVLKSPFSDFYSRSNNCTLGHQAKIFLYVYRSQMAYAFLWVENTLPISIISLAQAHWSLWYPNTHKHHHWYTSYILLQKLEYC